MITFDPLYLIFAIPGFILSVLASLYVKSTFAANANKTTCSGLTGAEAADAMLQAAGIHDVAIEHVHGYLSDHYDPTAKTLRLSDSVYASRSISAIGVACHEAGHAIQHAHNYAPLSLRSALVLPANIGSQFSYIIIIAGAFMHASMLVNLGLALFSLAVLFTLVTLPVEWDASSRAKSAMLQAGFVTQQEQSSASSVLNAAFLTYVAAAASAIMTLLYYLVRLGLIGGRNDD